MHDKENMISISQMTDLLSCAAEMFTKIENPGQPQSEKLSHCSLQSIFNQHNLCAFIKFLPPF